LSTSLRFEIASDVCESREVQRQIVDEVCHWHYHPEVAWAIKLALEEAMINAIKHGNKCNREKKVKVEASIGAQRTEITIEDEGEGFRREDVPDPTCDENLDRLHGRGILLIEAYMDEVQWLNGGRRVRMVKLNLPPEMQDDA
jgi:serine/threonine-protein kinase RsbW